MQRQVMTHLEEVEFLCKTLVFMDIGPIFIPKVTGSLVFANESQ